MLFSQQKVDMTRLSLMYNMADCTINVSDAEGFGLATLESLSCGTPIIVSMTGGLQEQVTDGKNQFGIPIYPSSKAIIGSQPIPWIYEDRLSGDDVINAMEKMMNMPKKQREKMGQLGRDHVLQNYNFDDFNKTWVDVMTNIHEQEGSWETRKHKKRWILKEVA